MNVRIRPAVVGDAEAIARLILDLSRFVLDDPTSPGALRFLDTLTPAATAERIASSGFDHLVAETDAGLCGVIAIRDGSHLHHLFVRADLHRRGVARALWSGMRERCRAAAITVNASAHAMPVYARFGFAIVGPPRSEQGLVSVPMRWDRARRSAPD